VFDNAAAGRPAEPPPGGARLIRAAKAARRTLMLIRELSALPPGVIV
jgi:hypothetical protein